MSQAELIISLTRIEQELLDAQRRLDEVREEASQLRDESRTGLQLGPLRIRWRAGKVPTKIETDADA